MFGFACLDLDLDVGCLDLNLDLDLDVWMFGCWMLGEYLYVGSQQACFSSKSSA